MKKIILCVVLLMSGLTIGAYAAGSHSGKKQNTSVTVVSDTTGKADDTGDADASGNSAANASSIQAQMDSAMQQAFDDGDSDDDSNNDGSSYSAFGTDDFGSHFVLLVLLIIFGLPVLLVAVILYFTYRNRKAKYELQKMALEKGVNPDTVLYAGNDTVSQTSQGRPDGKGRATVKMYNWGKLPDSVTPNEVLWAKGIKQMCIGIGVALVLGVVCYAQLSVIGLLIFFLGLGNAIIAKTRKDPAQKIDNFDVNQRYDVKDEETEEPAPKEKKEDDGQVDVTNPEDEKPIQK